MKVRTTEYTHVEPDGHLAEGGSIEVKPLIRMSRGEGCGLKGCDCSDGYWISVSAGRTSDGVVKSMMVEFKNKAEFDKFMRTHEIRG